jgi:hypothetical protein
MSSAFKEFRNWTESLAYASYSIAQFGSSLVSGGPVIQTFLNSIGDLTNSVLQYSTAAFNQATEEEVNRLAAGGAISNSFDKKLNFAEGLELFDEIKVQLARSAASLPGVTSDYITVFRSLSDDMATALNTAGLGGKELKAVFREKIPQAVEKLVLQSKLYGQDIPVSSITKTYSKLLSTGRVSSQEIFVQRNPVLRTGIEKWEKENGKKLPSLNIRERFDALNKIFADSISVEQMEGLTDSFQAKVETLKSYVLDPDVGLFGFEREFKLAGGETTSMFKELSKAIGPVIDTLATLTQNLIAYGDPFVLIATIFNSTIGVQLKRFGDALGTLNQMIQVTDGDFKTKLRAGLKKAFDFDYETFDFAAAITKFFDKIAKFIETFGDNIKPDDRLGLAMSATIQGLFKVLSAVVGRVIRQIATHPVESFKFIALTNPALIFQGITAASTAFAVIAPVVKLFGSILMGLFRLTGLGPIISSVMTALGSLAVWPLAIIAALAGIVIFRDQLISAGKHFTDLGNNMTGPFKDAFILLGTSLTLLGEAGKSLADAWNKFASGDWRGAIIDVWSGLGKTLSGLIAGLGSGFSAAGGLIQIAWDGLWPQLQRLGTLIVDGFVNLFTGKKNLDQLTESVGAAKVIKTPNANILQQGSDAAKTWANQWGGILGVGDVFQHANGNQLGNLLATINAERRAMPAGASIAIANSSEAIIPRESALQMLSSSGPSSGKSVTIGGINIYVTDSNASATDIGAEVRRQLIDLLT